MKQFPLSCSSPSFLHQWLPSDKALIPLWSLIVYSFLFPLHFCCCVNMAASFSHRDAVGSRGGGCEVENKIPIYLATLSFHCSLRWVNKEWFQLNIGGNTASGCSKLALIAVWAEFYFSFHFLFYLWDIKIYKHYAYLSNQILFLRLPRGTQCCPVREFHFVGLVISLFNYILVTFVCSFSQILAST